MISMQVKTACGQVIDITLSENKEYIYLHANVEKKNSKYVLPIPRVDFPTFKQLINEQEI
jgi:hypothetical protein